MNPETDRPLFRSLCNLTARALLGEWPTDDDLRSQVMRLYRDAPYEAPHRLVTISVGVGGVVSGSTPYDSAQYAAEAQGEPALTAEQTKQYYRTRLEAEARLDAEAANLDSTAAVQRAMASANLEPPTTPSPGVLQREASMAECRDRRFHMQAKRQGKPCSSCGYPSLTAPTSGVAP